MAQPCPCDEITYATVKEVGIPPTSTGGGGCQDDAYFDAIEQFAPKTDFSEQDLNEIMQDTQVYKDWKIWTPEKVMAMKSTIESATKVALEDYFSEQK